MSHQQREEFLAAAGFFAATTDTLMNEVPAEAGKFPSGLVTTLPHGPPRRFPEIAAVCRPTPATRPSALGPVLANRAGS
jgi:hypothetical protein